MRNLDSLYARFLEAGFMMLRLALNSKNQDWVEAEYEVLHNAPSLIGEKNVERHRYFWFGERQRYIEWVSAEGPEEAKRRMEVYYQPIWGEMEPLITRLRAPAVQ